MADQVVESYELNPESHIGFRRDPSRCKNDHSLVLQDICTRILEILLKWKIRGDGKVGSESNCMRRGGRFGLTPQLTEPGYQLVSGQSAVGCVVCSKLHGRNCVPLF